MMLLLYTSIVPTLGESQNGHTGTSTSVIFPMVKHRHHHKSTEKWTRPPNLRANKVLLSALVVVEVNSKVIANGSNKGEILYRQITSAYSRERTERAVPDVFIQK